MGGTFERFSDDSRKAMAAANLEAQQLNDGYIFTHHILLGLLSDGTGMAGAIMFDFGVDIEKARLEVERITTSGATAPTEQKAQTPRARRIIERAIEEARRFKNSHINTGHLLLGLLHDPDSTASQVLMNLSVDIEGLRRTVEAKLEAESKP